MDDLFLEFLLEAEENLQAIQGALDVLVMQPDDEESFKRLLRALHTLKGGFGVFEMKSAQDACHQLENLCGQDGSRHGKEFYLWLQEATQGFEGLIQQAREAKTPSDIPITIPPQPTAGETSPSLEDEFAIAELTVEQFFGEEKKPEKEEVKVEAKEEIKEQPKPAPVPEPQPASATVRVPLAKVDTVLAGIWEAFMARNRMSYLIEQSRPHLQEAPALLRTWESLDSSLRRLIGDLESQVMDLRMVTLSGVFQRMSRVVQQFVHSHGKSIEFESRGENIELDKRIVDSLADPLIHLIRNAMDHGIEPPDVRKAKGKDPTGKIQLTAEISGAEVVISVIDDGKGLDPEVLRQTAIKRGLSHAAQVSDEQAINLIFESGFSTAESVSEISGRGVGMDAVKTQIEALSGRIEVKSSVDVGSTFLIRIPLSVSVLNSLICTINGMEYAIPHTDIIEAHTLDQSELKPNGPERFYNFRGEPIPVFDMTKLFPRTEREELSIIERKVSLLVVRTGEDGSACKYSGLVVSGISHNQEVVIKPIPPLALSLPYVSGVSILADGRPIFLLSPNKLIQQRCTHVAMAS